MDRRRAAVAAAALLSLFLLVLGVAVLRSGSLSALLRSALAGAAGAAAGPGLMDSMTNAMVPTAGKAAATSLPQASGGQDAPAAAAEPPAQAPCPDGSCAGADGAETAIADAGADAAEDMRLKLIKMKERMQGQTEMYLDSKNAASSARSAASAGGPDSAGLESTMSGFIQKLKDRAAAGGGAGGVAGLGGGSSTGGDGGASGGVESPIITNGRIDSKLDSPTLRALQRVNSQGVHSLNMSRDAGTTDGSRDKAGKGFDGNEGDRGEIPIDVVKGAFGQKHIIIVPDDNPPPPR